MEAYDTPRFWINVIATIAFILCAGFYPFFWLLITDIAQSMQMYSVLLISAMVMTAFAPMAFKQKTERLDMGCFLVLSAVVWFVAPYRPFEFWAVNPSLISDALKTLFGGFRFTYNHDAVNVIGLNLLWFLIFAFGVALVKSSEVWKGLLSPGGPKEPYRSKSTVFGSATWGDWSKMRKEIAPPKSATGIVMGEDYDPRERKGEIYGHGDANTWGRGGKSALIEMSLTYEGGHALIVSGSAGGKTAAYIIPTCLHYTGGLIVVDPDREAIMASYKTRTQTLGRKIREINFKPGCSIDLMAIMKPYYEKDNMAFRDIAESMLMMKSKTSFEKFYFDSGVDLVAALLEHFCIEMKQHPFEGIAETLNMTTTEVKARYGKIATNSSLANVQSVMKQMATQSDDFFGWLQPTMKQSLNWMVHPHIRSSLMTGDDAGSGHPLAADTDVFITIPSDRLDDMGGYTKLILGVMAYHLKHRETYDHRRMVIVDEASSLGYVPLFETMRDKTRKNGVHLMLIFQTLGQIRECYGQTAVSDWASVGVRAFSAVEDIKEAEEISKIVGSYTADIEGHSASSRRNPVGMMANSLDRSKSSSLQRAALINADDVRTLPADSQILIFRRQRPYICGKALAFRRKEWEGYPSLHSRI